MYAIFFDNSVSNVPLRSMLGYFSIFSQQPLPRQLYLPRRLTSLPSALGHTDLAPVPKLELILDVREGTGAMMWEMYAGESPRAEVVAAVGYRRQIPSVNSLPKSPTYG